MSQLHRGTSVSPRYGDILRLPAKTARERPVVQAMLKSDHVMRQFATELRDARLGAGLSQRPGSRGRGHPRSSIERLELGHTPKLSIRTAGMVAAAAGLDLAVRFYPGGPHIRAVAQLRPLERLRARLGPEWRWRSEVPLPDGRHRRAWDATARHSGTQLRVVVDAETRIHDAQDLLRRIGLKARDDGTPRAVLLVADTRTTRLRWREASAVFEAAFPVGTRSAFSALAAGQDPGKDAIVII